VRRSPDCRALKCPPSSRGVELPPSAQLVTGSSGGIGEDFAVEFAKRKVNLVLETEFFARTGEEFLTSGRQTSQQFVDTAMAAIDKSSPTVVSGLRNALLASAYRFSPRRMLLGVSERIMKAN